MPHDASISFFFFSFQNCMFPAQKAQTVALLWLCFNDGCTCLANKKVFSWGGYASSALH